jgi:DNA-binding Lrp family transcriptional regulator
MKGLESEILEILQTNARISTDDLAKMVNSSKDEVSKIITSLEKKGIILQYRTIINHKKLAKNHQKVRAIIELGVRPEKQTGFDNIAKRICSHKEVVDHFLVSGRYDFLIIVEGESLEEISSFVAEKLATIENVRETATHFIMKKYKVNGVVMEKTSTKRLVVSA